MKTDQSYVNEQGRRLMLEAQPRGRLSAPAGRPKKGKATRSVRGAEPLWFRAASGAMLGVLVWLAAGDLGLSLVPALASAPVGLAVAAAGMLAGAGRLRRLLWVITALVCAGVLVVGYTPLVVSLTRGWRREDRPARADAVVVLGADGDPEPGRLLRAYDLLLAGYAPVLVIERGAADGPMKRLRPRCRVEEIGPQRTMRQEVVAVSELARGRGWRRVLVVSDPLRLRRAAATFKKAGLDVLCSAGDPRALDPARLATPAARRAVFREWAGETAAYQAYRLRGWID